MSTYNPHPNEGNDSEQLRENETDDRPALRLHQRNEERAVLSEANQSGAWISADIDDLSEVRR